MFCDIKFQSPFTSLISGPTGSGKSHTTFRLIHHRREMIRGNIDGGVIYCLPPGQNIEVPDFIQNDSEVTFHAGIPDFTSSKFSSRKSFLVILDDLMSNVNDDVMDLFTRQSHHKNISVVFLVQNLFYGSKCFRTISINCQYMIILKNPRDKRQLVSLSSQTHPDNVKFVKEAFSDATSEPFSYILLDLSQTCPDPIRFRSNIFPDDFPRNIIYVPNNSKKNK